MKLILKQILKDREKGYIMSIAQVEAVQSEWLRIFSNASLSCYPYVTVTMMFEDLLDHYEMV